MSRLLKLWRETARDHAELFYQGSIKGELQECTLGIGLLLIAGLVMTALAAMVPA